MTRVGVLLCLLCIHGGSLCDNSIAETATQSSNSSRTQVGVDVGLEYLVIESTDLATESTATFLARPSWKARFTLDVGLSQDWILRARFHYQWLEIKDDTTVPFTPVYGASHSLFGAELGLMKMRRSMRTGLFATYRERIFDYSQNILVVRFEKLRIPGAMIYHEVDFVNASLLSLGAAVAAELTLSTTGQGFNTGVGISADGIAYLKLRLGRWSLHGNVYYGVTRQTTTYSRRDEDRFGFMSGLYLRM